MNEEKKAVNLFPVCVAFNHLQLFADGSAAVNPAMIESWEANSDGFIILTMQSGRKFWLDPEEARKLIDETQKAIEIAKRQVERQNSRIALPEIMH